MSEEVITTEGGTANTGTPDGGGDVWYGGFPDELKGSELISKHETPESLAKEYLDINNKYAELQSSLPQIPESPDAYELEIPEGVQVDDGLVGWFKQAAFENKVPADVAKNIVSGFLQKQQEATERATQEFQAKIDKEIEDGTNALRQAWGDSFDARVGKMEHVLNKYMPEDAREFIKNSGVGRDPEFIKGFWGIISRLGEDEFAEGGAAHNDKGRTDSMGRPMLRFPSMESRK